MSERKRTQEENEELFRPAGTEVTFRFENNRAAELFLAWMSNQGEQDYWDAMEYCEKREPGPITGTEFDYHDPGHGIVMVGCGRLDGKK